jgi:hypothetical protein
VAFWVIECCFLVVLDVFACYGVMFNIYAKDNPKANTLRESMKIL